MAIRHPTTGKGVIKWDYTGVFHVAHFEQQAKYRRGTAYSVRTLFAQIRPAYNESGLLDASAGWVVTRNSFDELREFSDIDAAKLYVEALFALEYSAE